MEGGISRGKGIRAKKKWGLGKKAALMMLGKK